MYNISIDKSTHSWKKKNLITLPSNKGGYDILICANCGMRGKTYTLGVIQLKGSYSFANVKDCPKAPKTDKPKAGRVKITRCNAMGKVFENLTDGSEHDIVDTPEGEHSRDGVWIMGVGVPVKVLDGEYIVTYIY